MLFDMTEVSCDREGNYAVRWFLAAGISQAGEFPKNIGSLSLITFFGIAFRLHRGTVTKMWVLANRPEGG